MNKAERLFQLVSLLRARRTAITAEAIAETMEVSVRTVYRDIQSLALSGVPVQGEPGIGYRLKPDYQLPPLMFDPDELLSLLVGGRMVQAFTDPELARAARLAEQKIRSILTEPLKLLAEKQPYRIPILERDTALRTVHGTLRQACEAQRKIRATYVDEQRVTSQRVIWPLGLIGWTGRWTLLAWCELRQDYRNFRFDRFEKIEPLDEFFATTPTINLEYYITQKVCAKDVG